MFLLKNASMMFMVLFFAFQAQTFAAQKPIALVYKGVGACTACVWGAAHVATLAGFKVKFIPSGSNDYSVFQNAKVWIQPGGVSVTQAKSMGPELMAHVRQFVTDGGGYVGFCAGSFLSTSKIGSSGVEGFGFIPGSTYYHHEDGNEAWQIEPVMTAKGRRSVYFAGGPKFIETAQDLNQVNGSVIATALNGDIEAITAHYGHGKVAVSGFHPEASEIVKAGRLFVSAGYESAAKALLKSTVYGPTSLFESSPYFTLDEDGSDYDFAIQMIQFATK